LRCQQGNTIIQLYISKTKTTKKTQIHCQPGIKKNQTTSKMMVLFAKIPANIDGQVVNMDGK
jgi:hypothetical protein